MSDIKQAIKNALDKMNDEDLKNLKKRLQGDEKRDQDKVEIRTRPKEGQDAYKLLTKQSDHLKELYYEKKMTFGRDRIFQYLQDNWNKKASIEERISRRQVMEWLKDQELAQLYKSKKKQKGDIARTVMNAPFKQIGIDLVDMSTKEYKGMKWILTGIDLFSKKGYAIALKDKESKTVTNGFLKLLKTMKKKPSTIRSDNGSEFIGKPFVDMMKKQDIKHIFSKAESPQSNGQVENFNKILKRLIAMNMTQHNDSDWAGMIKTLLTAYNSTESRVTKRTPNEIEDESQKSNETVKKNIQKEVNKKNENETNKPKYIKGDKVRITLENIGKSKSFRNWSDEIYTVNRVNKATSGNVYKSSYQLRDPDNKVINKKFFENELQRIDKVEGAIKEPKKFIISSLVKPYVNKNGDRFFEVRWKGYSAKDNTLEPYEQLKIDVPKMVAKAEKDMNIKWNKRSVKYK